jgi:hypothetical protein
MNVGYAALFKGTMSEAELHFLRGRLEGGKLNKARRGELRTPLPAGLLYDNAGRIMLDPDREIQAALRCIFHTFQVTSSAWMSVRLMSQSRVRLPVRERTGKYAGQIRWVPPSLSRVLRVLKNPRYAGVYFYGRTRQKKGIPSGTLPREQWKVFLSNAHPGYISLEEFESIQRTLQQNSVTARTQATETPPREGPALLQGLLVCGRCGRRMSLRYQHRRGRVHTLYYCQRQATEYGGKLCQHLPGNCVDQAVSQLVVEALTHEAIEVALAVYQELGRQHEELAVIHRNRIERARHEADMAERQFLLVNPENRLVADNLERRWNDALRAVAEAEETFAQWNCQHSAPLDRQTEQQVRELVEDFPAVWDHPQTTARQRKQLLRLLIEDVTLLRQEQITISVRWKGGTTSRLSVPVPVNGFEAKRTNPKVLQCIAAWAEQYTDEEIASRLNQEGMRTGVGLPFTDETVNRLRRAKGIAGLKEHLHRAGMRTTEEITQQTGIAESTLRKWRKAGFLKAVRCDHKHWLYEFPSRQVLRRIAQAQNQKCGSSTTLAI